MPPEPTVLLVPAAIAHRRFVRDLSAEVFARFGGYDRTLPEMLGLPWVRTTVAEADGEPIGFTMLSFEAAAGGECDLVAIAVSPARQSRGIGRMLLADVERAAREGITGRGHVVLTVAADNSQGRRLFERSGYRRTSDPQGTYPGGQRSITMSKPVEGKTR